MAITLGTVQLPDGLRWSDEFAWSPLAQSIEPSLTGALIIDIASRQAGRPITLIGGRQFAWITRQNLKILQALLDSATDPLTLTLHDARQFSVLPRLNNNASALDAPPLPVVRDSGYANPPDSAWYIIEQLRLIVVA